MKVIFLDFDGVITNIHTHFASVNKEFVIIEDDYIMKTLYPHQVFIENSDGLRAEYVAPAIRILTGNLGFYPEEYNRSETFQERIERSFPNVIIKEEKMTKNLEKVLNKCKRDIMYYNKK